jgi:3-oxoacyl-[acyl-carrier protein] reductase
VSSSVGRVAIVTGGSRGIGLAICRRLAHDGMNIHLVYLNAQDAARSVAAEIEAAGGRAVAHQADVSSEAEVATLVDDIVNKEGTVHVLVNNAGVIDDRLLALTDLAQWDRVLRVNLTGSFLMSRAVVPAMIDQGWGRIINISSNSVRVPSAGQSAYAASKGGLEALTRALAAEVGRKGIRVNAVAPGRIKTDMTASFWTRSGADDGESRWGLPEDVSGIVGFLASDEADYVQGQTITVDGGRLVTRQRVARRPT